MYDFKLWKDEKVMLISDNTVIYIGDELKNYTCIITNQRILILDYPSGIHNSMEDLRISGKISYIRKKEVILEISFNDIVSLKDKKYFYRIHLNGGKYIDLNNDEIISYLKKRL